MDTHKNIYFASDFHLGFPDSTSSKKRELLIIEWLNEIKPHCKELYLLGDVFDFWYEYKWVVPKGHIRFLGKLAEFVDAGIPVHIFKGNHDQWYKSYLHTEIGVEILDKPVIREYNGKTFYIHHGHALGKFDKGMNFLHACFTNKILQWLFSRIHPNTAFGIAHRWSSHNRKAKIYESSNYLGDDKEWLLLHAQHILQNQHIDFFIFGHRHIAVDKKITPSSTYINTGNWITNTSYAVFDGTEIKLCIYKPDLFPEEKIYT
ncbi:MAG: UDP-2,3-diacylglucosamine diphosphatase [Bacteroidales bacterium]